MEKAFLWQNEVWKGNHLGKQNIKLKRKNINVTESGEEHLHLGGKKTQNEIVKEIYFLSETY